MTTRLYDFFPYSSRVIDTETGLPILNNGDKWKVQHALGPTTVTLLRKRKPVRFSVFGVDFTIQTWKTVSSDWSPWHHPGYVAAQILDDIHYGFSITDEFRKNLIAKTYTHSSY